MFILVASCSPPAWQSRCQEYGCDYAGYNYCVGTQSCEVWDADGACIEFQPCTERFSPECKQYRGVSRADLDEYEK